MKLWKSLLVFLIFLSLASSSYAWLDNWEYRFPVNIASFEDVSDYQIEINKGFAREYKEGKINYDCSDIRFTDYNENLLDFWTEECDVKGNSKFWVKLPSSKNRAIKNKIYLYYGNEGVGSLSDGYNTFLHFDDYAGSEECPKIFDNFSLGVWEQYERNPIIEPHGEGLDNKSVRGFAPMIDKDGYMVVEDGHYIGYYMGYGYGVDESRIFRTVSEGLKRTEWLDGVLVLDQGEVGEWDDSTTATGNVIKLDENYYLMTYVGKNSSDNYGIGIATSYDGINWEKYIGNPVLTEYQFYGQDGVSNVKPSIPYMIKLSTGKYVMGMEGIDPSLNHFQIFFATSVDGYNWTPMHNGSAGFLGEPDSWDSEHVANPKLIELSSGQYLMTYNGKEEGGSHKLFLGAAHSTDLINWTRYSKNPFLTGTSEYDFLRVEDPVVIKDDLDSGVIGMYYFGCNSQCHNSGSKTGAVIEYATSNQSLLCVNSSDERRFVQTEQDEAISGRFLSNYFSWLPSYREEGFDSKLINKPLNDVAVDFSIYFTYFSLGEVGIKNLEGDRFGARLKFGGEDFQNEFLVYNNQSDSWIPIGVNYEHFVWNDISIVQKSNSNFDFYFNDESVLNLDNFDLISDIGMVNFNADHFMKGSFFIDNIKIRKHLDRKPFVLFAAEQRNPSRKLNKY